MSEPERIPEWARDEAGRIALSSEGRDADIIADTAERSLMEAYRRGREDAARVAQARLQAYADFQAKRPPSENADAEPRLFSAVFMRDEVTAAIRAGGVR